MSVTKTTLPVAARRARSIRNLLVFAAISIGSSLVGINFFEPEWVLITMAALVVVVLCWKFTDIAFYGAVFLYPFINWQLQVDGFNLPYIDGLAALIFAVWFLKKIVNPAERLSWKDFPGLAIAVVFFAAGALSLLNAEFLASSFKYWLRPLMFFYFAYVVMPYAMIKQHKQVSLVFRLMVAAGVAVAIMGVLSIIFSAGPWYTKRAVPLAIGGFDPLGGNQNAIAEVLVVTIPLALALFAWAKSYRAQAGLLITMAGMLGVLLLTFSRAGWLALLAQLFILFVFQYRKRIHPAVLVTLIVSFIVLPIVLYFGVWQNISWVQASNTNRILLSQIAFHHFWEHPLIGNGPNSFQRLVGETFVFIVEFGDPLESHGFIQKILTEQGLIGLVSFSALLFYIFYRYRKAFVLEKNEKEKFVLLCVIMMGVGIVFFELFSTSYYISRMWFPLGVGLAVSRLYIENNAKRQKRA